MTPFFSIVTVHFNQLEALKVTVDKMREQEGSGTLFEHIVVDGASGDGTSDYLATLSSQPGFRFISEKDRGIYDAMNKGVSLSKGQYIFFINAGDYFAKTDLLTGLQKQVKGEAAVYGDTLVSYGHFTRKAKAQPLNEFWKCLPFVHQSICVRKDLLLKHPFDLSYKYCADYGQLSSLFIAKAGFTYFPSDFAVVQAGGASDKGRVKAIKEVFAISRRHFHIKAGQRFYFRKELLKARWILLLKKLLPASWTGKLTRLKYSEK